tara:strand:- start:408 stop:518 length:111 start_codon:yes stop_codon:yes gene_type:complete
MYILMRQKDPGHVINVQNLKASGGKEVIVEALSRMD